MTVFEFLSICIDDTQKFAIYDFAKDETLWTGLANDLPDSLDNYEVLSYDGVDNNKIITINIDTEDY